MTFARSYLLWLLVLGMFLLGHPSYAATFTSLGQTPSEANSVSADGVTVVGFRTTGAFGIEAFRWTSGSGMEGLGDLPDGKDESSAYGVSADGIVVVGVGNYLYGEEAFYWTTYSGVIGGLGTLSGGGHGSLQSRAYGVSADSWTIVGYSSGASGDEAFRTVIVDDFITLEGLGDLTGGSYFSVALDVSANGSTIVGYSDGASGSEAFRWTNGGGMVGLGDLPNGSFSSTANATCPSGATVVGWGTSASGIEAFRWTSGGGMVGLSDLPGGDFNSQAQGVSSGGSTVVGWGTSASGSEAFIWDGTNGMRNLRTVLTNLGLDLTGWTLLSAQDISDDGNVIVGYGTNPSGIREAWIVDLVPEPSTPLLQGVALLVLAGLTARRRTVVSS